MVEIISKSEFAKLAGVSKAAVTNACRASLLPAVVNGKVDRVHPAAFSYLSKKRSGAVRYPAPPFPKEPSDKELAQTADIRLRVAEKAKLLVAREMVSRSFAAIGDVFSEFIGPMAQEIAVKVCKEVGAVSDIDVVEGIISGVHLEAVRRLMEVISRED